MQIVILTDYARNLLLICPMEFVFIVFTITTKDNLCR
jgi:hypothetical protein